jgi:hypothetical protein
LQEKAVEATKQKEEKRKISLFFSKQVQALPGLLYYKKHDKDVDRGKWGEGLRGYE